MLFADDSLFICRASSDQCQELFDVLGIYEKVSGQKINTVKSAITFGSRVSANVKVWIKSKSGIQMEGGTRKYLGLPKCLSGSKQQLLGYIKDNCQKRLNGWYAKTLSQGGKEILLKSVAMPMHVYALTCFKLPVKLCKDRTSAMMDLTEENKNKIHWVGWEKLTLPKRLGGIGFRDLQLYNQALLAKQAWRLLHDPHSLFGRSFKSRYYADTNLMSASKGRRSIGNGRDTLVWVDNWLYDGIPSRPGGRHSLMKIDLRVAYLIDNSTQNWIMEILRDLFNRDAIELISRQRPCVSRDDSYHSGLSGSGLIVVSGVRALPYTNGIY
ncbi:unnamed protein product [Microthlaspi erraticum]|uniref:Reverse transcriptase domain-containing protein n=1 Tax=Microthlaspi erraticum TaxID=1685480 RepID=A0A6D2J1N4_9BRAS|nr:unnamed protein product [Microthlaspi erraticum]CAA7036227.1 unnamed protein product [Microthlaspi erraticum]